MAMISANGVELHVERMPARNSPGTAAPPTVVFVHGMLIDSLISYYFTLAAVFAAAGLDVIMYDQRGHGRSERPPSGYLLEDSLGDLDALLDGLEVTGPVHLVGYSYGGTVAFGYAALRPDRVASVSMIESEPATEAWSRKMAVNLERAAAGFAEAAGDEALAEEHGPFVTRRVKSASRLLHTTTLARDIPASRVLDEDEIRSVRCPVLAVYGSESELAAREPWLKSLLTDCRTVVVPNQEHWILLGATQVVSDLIMAWILNHEGAHRPDRNPPARPREARTAGVEHR
ncbi:pimeloyl-ACP methyl ester carboxylesterase [Streptomyces griseochromogenes]|uniref:Hydrolase n=2 Tax=Streptomyces griseochromogenes TaxID=68214 RepID=A0A1B1AZE4_9ACTN|nr:hydrolase [Streptomyces griseochromogenes]MBP2056615.1 pimeloyl-ACP methyl ester carboxylesterase [Streptomyces griseochromogenes]